MFINVHTLVDNITTVKGCFQHGGITSMFEKALTGAGKQPGDVIAGGFAGLYINTGAGVVQIDNLQDALQAIGNRGFRHHVSATRGHLLESTREALEKYLGYNVIRV